MSTFLNKLLLYLVVVLFVVGFGFLVYSQFSHKASVRADEIAAVQTGNAAAATVHEAKAIQVYHEREKSNVEVEKVLQASPDWAAEPLPDAAADLLRNHPDPSE